MWLHTFPGLFWGCFQHKKRILFHHVGLVLPFHLCTEKALPSTVFLEFCCLFPFSPGVLVQLRCLGDSWAPQSLPEGLGLSKNFTRKT